MGQRKRVKTGVFLKKFFDCFGTQKGYKNCGFTQIAL